MRRAQALRVLHLLQSEVVRPDDVAVTGTHPGSPNHERVEG